MVQTFLTTSDFTESAQSLDFRRLGKQRVEAYQILSVVQNLHVLAYYFNLPLPNDPSLWHIWIRRLVAVYNDLTVVLIRVSEDSYYWLPKTEAARTPDLKVVKMTFPVYHPVVKLWLAWPMALKAYINAHIREWIRRGYNNTMELYQLPPAVDMPPWINDPAVWNSHRMALLEKERTRGEKPWYVNMGWIVS